MTDPDARLYHKSAGPGAQLRYYSHTLMENHHGLVVEHETTHASGTAERGAAVEMVTRIPGTHRVTVGADKNYDTRACVGELRGANATPHVAQNDVNRRSAIDGRTTRHPGYQVSQRIRKRIEECFGWDKVIGPLRKVKLRGIAQIDFLCTLTYTAYNLVRMRNLGLGIPSHDRTRVPEIRNTEEFGLEIGQTQSARALNP